MILWVRTCAGKSMPCDPELVTYWAQDGGKEKIVTPNGEVVSASLEGEANRATGLGYISHFATCPEAGRFKRR